jgi:hypothetical protein
MSDIQVDTTEEEVRSKWDQLLRGNTEVVDTPGEELVKEEVPVVVIPDNSSEAVLARLFRSMTTNSAEEA